MKYLAKARMLAFDFLTDPVVYALPPVEAMLLAGMVSRADNLGRLPGDPSVLLAYLFFPKAPRNDCTTDHVERLLRVCATHEPPIIQWYRVGGAAYVQFLQWEKHQPGLRPHNKKSSYPGPDAKGVDHVATPHGEPLSFPGMEPPPTMDARPVLAALTEKFTGGGAGFPAGDVAAWAEGKRELKVTTWFAFAHWLWNSGTRDPKVLFAVMERELSHPSENPWAYWAANGTAREATRMSLYGREAEAESEERRKHAREPLKWADPIL